MRRQIRDKIITLLTGALANVPVHALSMADLAQELTALCQSAVWVVYLSGDFESSDGLDRPGALYFAVTVATVEYRNSADRAADALELVERCDEALSQQTPGIAGAGPFELVSDGLVEPPEGVQGIAFHELVFRVQVNEAVKL